ncbi:helix-turn-helix domain-containing protein [Streptosporangium saharense]|uniref:Transcriptional regulator with XRE-family HTH domain n=1 Tax=Streptosporangium saharense TaxID=1706840 RepID=A0A7W7QW83_9ACTN|nr:helix-turn-helix transcriptional regulator [Streptosporangium saharense]MBB4920704.1 transcriptional regulator with XRE-family HTH domain [Streptosporangium saharense]
MSETFGQALRRLRGELSLRELARRASCAKSYIGDLESGRRRPSLSVATALDSALRADGELVALAKVLAPASPNRVEALRLGLIDAVASGPMSDASLDDWDHVVNQHGRATRYRPENELLEELTGDFADLSRFLSKNHSPATRKRMLRTAAWMAGLISLTILRMGDHRAARRWFRTSCSAATQVDDSSILSWVYAQEAYALYYGGDIAGAINTARAAQEIACGTKCVGVALSAPLEARAHARLGHAQDAEAAIERAEVALRNLDSESTGESAFAYNEAQLRFHQGNALTHLGQTGRAWEIQERALELYPTNDLTDRTLVRLDQAICLAREDVAAGSALATEAITALPPAHRSPLIMSRARDVVASVTTGPHVPIEVNLLHELVLAAEKKG